MIGVWKAGLEGSNAMMREWCIRVADNLNYLNQYEPVTDQTRYARSHRGRSLLSPEMKSPMRITIVSLLATALSLLLSTSGHELNAKLPGGAKTSVNAPN